MSIRLPLGAAAFLAAVGASYAWISASAGASGDAGGEPVPAAMAPQPVAEIPPQPSPTPAPPPVTAASAIQGFSLHGVSGSGTAGLAVLGDSEGAQRIVRVGRPLLPGLSLKSVGLDHVLLADERRLYRLDLHRYGTASGAGKGIPLGETPSSEADQRLASVALPRELTPVLSNGRIDGYTVRRTANLPRLRDAGIRDGDVIVSVNGSQFDEERMSELVWQLNNTKKTDFVLRRNGKLVRAKV